jgi:hypothetical protein
VAHEIKELGIEGKLRGPAEDHTLEVIVPVSVSHSCHLSEGSKVAIEEKLQAVPGIKVDGEVSRVGQNQDKSIEDSKRKSPLHPVHLGLLPRQKLQLMKPSFFLPPKRLGMNFHGIVAS